MRAAVLVYFFMIALTVHAQNKFEWSENYRLTIEDFLGSGTQIGNVTVRTVQTAAQIEFSYLMTHGEFMMTKNWNEKVKCMFTRDMAYLVADDDTTATELINFAQFDFDLAELHSRKLRKAIFDGKKMFSNPSMFQPLYDQVQREYQSRHVKVAKETDIGRKHDLLKTYHEEVLAELSDMPDFCRTCKPVRKKR